MTMTPEACQFSINMLLEQETDLTGQLSTLLDNEYAAITGKDFETFEQTIRDKTLTVEQLELLEKERISLLESAGYEPGPEGILLFMQWCDPGQDITPRWEQLLTLAAKCREKNRRNRQLIDLCSRHTRETLRILRGEEAQQDIYQADGDTDGGHDRRTLARV